MQVKQIYTLVNSITDELTGHTAVLQEDLSNIVDVGAAVINLNQLDNYVKQLVNRIGKTVFENRVYSSSVPSVLMDSWEFGSVLQKISCDIPDAVQNDSWDLTNGQDYSPNIFYKPSVEAKFFNSKTTFEIPMSFTEKQVKESFTSAAELNGFISMLQNSIDKSMSVKIDSLVMRTIDNMIAETMLSASATQKYGDVTGTKAVNLLKMYNSEFNKTLAYDKALSDKDFIRFATYTIGIWKERMTKLSELFNLGGKARFTPIDMQKLILLSDFKKASEVYLKSDTKNADMVALPDAESVPYWQGSGTGYDIKDIGAINCKLASDNSKTVDLKTNNAIVIGCLFDKDCLGVANLDRRVTTNYNPKAEFYTNWYKFDAGYFNDKNENFVVFYVAKPSAT